MSSDVMGARARIRANHLPIAVGGVAVELEAVDADLVPKGAGPALSFLDFVE